MNKYLIPLIALAFLSCNHAGNERKLVNYLSEKKLKGKVKTITYYTCYADGKEDKVIRVALDEKNCEKFDENGNMIEEIVYDNKNPGKIIDSFVYTNSADGKRIKAMRYNSDGTSYASYKYSYNSNGDITEDNRWDVNGVIHTQNVYEYKDKNLVKHQKLIHGEVVSIKEYKHNSFGDIIEEVEYGKDHSIIFSTTYYKYNIHGNKIEESCIWNNGKKYDKEYGYDDEGNEKSIKYIDDDHSYTTRFVYSGIDDEGNWHLKVALNEDHPNTVFDRKITYYSK